MYAGLDPIDCPPKVLVDQLPVLDTPWIMIKFKDDVLFVNENYPAFYVDKGTTLVPVARQCASKDGVHYHGDGSTPSFRAPIIAVTK